jgi:hypothetical protein
MERKAPSKILEVSTDSLVEHSAWQLLRSPSLNIRNKAIQDVADPGTFMIHPHIV